MAPLRHVLPAALLAFSWPLAAQPLGANAILEQLQRAPAAQQRAVPVNDDEDDDSGLRSRSMRNLTVSANTVPPIPSGDPLERLCEPATALRHDAATARGRDTGGAEAHALGLRNLVVRPSSSIDLKVEFDFGRATLRPEGILQLDQLAAALHSPALANARFVVAGHTDGVGSAASNDRLSCARALAAKHYLVAQRHVDGTRLLTLGWGASRLLHPTQPQAAENRRVEIKTLARD